MIQHFFFVFCVFLFGMKPVPEAFLFISVLNCIVNSKVVHEVESLELYGLLVRHKNALFNEIVQVEVILFI